MVSPRFNLIEKLTYISNQKPSKDSAAGKKRSFDHGDIPDIFRNMYDTANTLASKEGLIWIQLKHKQDIIEKLQKPEQSGTVNIEDNVLPPLLETQLWDYVCKRRAEFIQQMTQMLDLYATSKWADKKSKMDNP